MDFMCFLVCSHETQQEYEPTSLVFKREQTTRDTEVRNQQGGKKEQKESMNIS